MLAQPQAQFRLSVDQILAAILLLSREEQKVLWTSVEAQGIYLQNIQGISENGSDETKKQTLSTQIVPLLESLPYTDQVWLIQFLLTRLIPLQSPSTQATEAPDADSTDERRGQRMAAVFQRMADRNALSEITDPVAWQREVRHSSTI